MALRTSRYCLCIRVPRAVGMDLLCPAANSMHAQLGYAILERSRYLYKYLSAAHQTEPQFSESILDAQIHGALDTVIPASWAGRVLYQRVERWAPIPLDDATTRDEALSKISDVASFPSFFYLGQGNSVLAGYRTLLTELRRDALIRGGSTNALRLVGPFPVEILFPVLRHFHVPHLPPTSKRLPRSSAGNVNCLRRARTLSP